MWAFVIWDGRDQSAFIARDRFGVKPLYYARTADCIIFASEPKFILAVLPSSRAVNERALYQVLAETRVDVSRQSFYPTIEVLAAASYAIVRPGDRAVEARAYWRYPDGDESAFPQAHEQLESEFGRLLEDSVRLRLRSGVPVGLTLSGGLDSTSVLAAAQRVDPDRLGHAFTSVYAGTDTYDERSWAQAAAAPYPRVALEEVEASGADWLETLEQIIWHMDGPGLSPAVFPLWKIMRQARAARIPVLLEGQGADELLGGYAVHRAHAVLDRATELRRHPRLAEARVWADMLRSSVEANGPRRTSIDVLTVLGPGLRSLRNRHAGTHDVLTRDFVEHAGSDEVDESNGARTGRSTSRLAAKLERDFSRDTLPAFLQYGDAISMAHGIESRLPFLDFRMVEFCVRLPAALRGGGNRSKEVLRSYLRGAGQSRIAARMDKKGFLTSAHTWLGANNGEVPRDLLLAPNARIAPYIDRHAVARLIERQAVGRYAGGDRLYALTTAEIWLRTCVGAAG
jgi:asparagine synthase (glutamine-hydrolysing)